MDGADAKVHICLVPNMNRCIFPSMTGLFLFKGKVSRDFEWLQMILMDRLCVPDVSLEV